LTCPPFSRPETRTKPRADLLEKTFIAVFADLFESDFRLGVTPNLGKWLCGLTLGGLTLARGFPNAVQQVV